MKEERAHVGTSCDRQPAAADANRRWHVNRVGGGAFRDTLTLMLAEMARTLQTEQFYFY